MQTCVIRANIPDQGFRAGELCLADIRRTASARVIPEGRPWKLVWLPRSALLPLRQVFADQPKSKFWVMAKRRAFLSGDPSAFVSRPRLCAMERFGCVPWRFESLGELVYWANSRRLKLSQYVVLESKL